MCFCPHGCVYFGTVEDLRWLFWYSGRFGISGISRVTETARGLELRNGPLPNFRADLSNFVKSSDTKHPGKP